MKMRTFTNKLLTIIMTLVCLMNVFVPAFAAVKRTEVLFVCKVANDIETDDYDPVVVKLLNEDTGKTYSYNLYKYNKFMERYVMDNGRYSIIYAYIKGRPDIIFDVDAKTVYEVGHSNNIYFELSNSGLLGDGSKNTTTTTTTTSKITEEPTTKDKTELSTLFPILTTGSDKTNKSDKTEKSLPDDTSTTQNNSEPVTEPYETEVTSKTSTRQERELNELSKKISVTLIVLFILIIIFIAVFGVIYTKKNKE